MTVLQTEMANCTGCREKFGLATPGERLNIDDVVKKLKRQRLKRPCG